jgi:Tfp pilus assembly protein PilF
MQSILTLTQKKMSKLGIGFKSEKVGNTLASLVLVVLLSACAAPQVQVGLSDLSARPGESAMLAGIRSYEEAQYPQAEKSLTEALAAGFTVKKDAALAYKYLAFIYCTTTRLEECKGAFVAARAADPGFALNKKEIGHPVWGPVYKQVTGE